MRQISFVFYLLARDKFYLVPGMSYCNYDCTEVREIISIGSYSRRKGSDPNNTDGLIYKIIKHPDKTKIGRSYPCNKDTFINFAFAVYAFGIDIKDMVESLFYWAEVKPSEFDINLIRKVLGERFVLETAVVDYFSQKVKKASYRLKAGARTVWRFYEEVITKGIKN